jgi:hypothetical protein
VSWAIFASMLLGWLLVSFLSFVYLDVMFHVSGPIFAFVTGVLIFISFRDQVRAKLLYFLRVLKTENDQLRNEIDQAKEIAKVFIPAETPEWPGVAFSTFNKPFVDTSGDWFAFEKSPCGRYVHALLCDITGHGVQAAIVVSACRAVLSMITHDRKNLSSPLFLEIYLGALNSTLYAQGRGTHVTTMVGVTVDIEENIAYFVSAGHPSPFYVHVESDEMFQIKLLNSRNNPVGFEKESNIHCGKIQIFPGDSILMFSDGIPFPRNMSRLKELFTQRVDKRIRPSSAENLVNATWRAKNSGQAGVVDDDQSLIWLQFHPQDFQQEKLKKIA